MTLVIKSMFDWSNTEINIVPTLGNTEYIYKHKTRDLSKRGFPHLHTLQRPNSKYTWWNVLSGYIVGFIMDIAWSLHYDTSLYWSGTKVLACNILLCACIITLEFIKKSRELKLLVTVMDWTVT